MQLCQREISIINQEAGEPALRSPFKEGMYARTVLEVLASFRPQRAEPHVQFSGSIRPACVCLLPQAMLEGKYISIHLWAISVLDFYSLSNGHAFFLHFYVVS